jgi:hypothetical protein
VCCLTFLGTSQADLLLVSILASKGSWLLHVDACWEAGYKPSDYSLPLLGSSKQIYC